MLRQGEGTAEGVADKEAALQHFHAAAARGHFKVYTHTHTHTLSLSLFLSLTHAHTFPQTL